MPAESQGFDIGSIPAFRPTLAPSEFVSTGGQAALGRLTQRPQIQPISAAAQQSAQLDLQAKAQQNQLNQIAVQKGVKEKMDNDALDAQVMKLSKEIASTPNPDDLSPFAKALYKAQLITGTPVVYTGTQMQQVMSAAAQRADMAQQQALRQAQTDYYGGRTGLVGAQAALDTVKTNAGGFAPKAPLQIGTDPNGAPIFGSVTPGTDGAPGQITPIPVSGGGPVLGPKNPASLTMSQKEALQFAQDAHVYGIDPNDPDALKKIGAARQAEHDKDSVIMQEMTKGGFLSPSAGTSTTPSPAGMPPPSGSGNTTVTPGAPGAIPGLSPAASFLLNPTTAP